MSSQRSLVAFTTASVLPGHRRVVLPCSVISLLASFVSCVGRFCSSILLLGLLAYASKGFECCTWATTPHSRLVWRPISHPPLVYISPPSPPSPVGFLAIVIPTCCFISLPPPPRPASVTAKPRVRPPPSLVPGVSRRLPPPWFQSAPAPCGCFRSAGPGQGWEGRGACGRWAAARGGRRAQAGTRPCPGAGPSHPRPG